MNGSGIVLQERYARLTWLTTTLGTTFTVDDRTT